MGRQTQGISGNFIGKVGTVIGYQRHGRGFIKSLYKKRTKAASPAEALNRKKFGIAQKWLAPLTAYTRLGFQNYSEKSRGFIAAKSWMLKHAMIFENDNYRIDPAEVKISMGTLKYPEIIEIEFDDNFVKLNWSDELGQHDSPFDQLMMVIYNPELKKEIGIIYGPFRSAREYTLEIQHNQPGISHVYCAFISPDRTDQSDSVYLGEVEI